MISGWVIEELTHRCLEHFGTGYRHGSLPLRPETYEKLVEFILEEAERLREAGHLS